MLRAVSGSGSSAGSAAFSSRGKPSIVGTRGCTAFGTNYSTSQEGVDGRTLHYLPYGAESLAVAYIGWGQRFSQGDSTQLPNGNYYTVTAAVVVGGTGYAEGDLINPVVATNNTAPKLMVMAVNAGVVTSLAVLSPGLLNAVPAAGLATTHSSGSGNDALTVTLTVAPSAVCLNIALEQTGGTQTAYSNSNTGGVLPMTQGFNQTEGNITVIVPSGGVGMTDQLPLTGLTSSSQIAIRYATNGSGMQRNYAALAAERDSGNSFTIYNAGTVFGGTMNATGGAASLPAAILGYTSTPRPSVVIGGDSIGYGTQSVANASGGSTSFDTVDAYGNMGFVSKAIGISQPFITMAQSGETVADWLSTANQLRWNFLNNELSCTHFIDQLGTNDISSGAINYATFLARKIAFWKRLQACGVGEIWATGITPYNTSTIGLSQNPTIAAGGTGYAASSTFTVTLAGGTGTAAQVSVSTNGSGVVTTVNSVVAIGYYTVVPASPNSPTGGTGTGLSLNLIMARAVDVASQTVGAGNPTRIAYNQAGRAGTLAQYGVTRFLDTTPYTDTTLDSGIWLPGTTFDSVHNSTTNHDTIAAAFASAMASMSV